MIFMHFESLFVADIFSFSFVYSQLEILASLHFTALPFSRGYSISLIALARRPFGSQLENESSQVRTNSNSKAAEADVDTRRCRCCFTLLLLLLLLLVVVVVGFSGALWDSLSWAFAVCFFLVEP